ncbi:hypothetical protein Tco_0859122 [Tanacetum coccineum]|uniref:Uncharacterized protein n=1 Tax=Tanacetum coccineum TaxID=301880 RepID=A0ABQ5BB81_9ASTR
MERAATTVTSLDVEQDIGDRPAQARVLALENIKTAQDLEITSLKKRVKKLEKKKKARTPQLKRRLFKGSALVTTAGVPVTTASTPITTTGVFVSTIEPSTPLTTTILIEDEDLIIAQTLMKMRSEKSKEKLKEKGVSSETATTTTTTRGVTMQEPSEFGTRKIVPPPEHDPKDKGKEELHEELEEEERLAKQREEEANLVSWDNTQAMMEADYELAQRLQAKEHGELTIEERSKLFVVLMDKRKKNFAKLRAKEIRIKPPNKVQKRNQMSTYLRNMAGYKHTQLKGKSYKEIQMLFDKEMKRVNTFVAMDSEVVESSGKEAVSKKREGEELDEESVKRQKLEDDAEKAELQLCLEIVRRDVEAVNVESLSIKYLIVNWKTQIPGEDKIRDVLDLYRLVKERFETASLEGYDRLL